MIRRALVLAILSTLVLIGCQGSSTPAPTPAPKTAAAPKADAAAAPGASVSGSPAAKPSPSPSPAAGAASGPAGPWILTTDGLLVVTGIVLTIVTAIGWIMANRAEAMPTAEQAQELHHFVTQHFARYVAQGLMTGGAAPASIARDRAWRKIFLQHLRLHNELYGVRRDAALQVYEREIDAGVLAQMQQLRTDAAGPAAGGA